MCKVLPLDIFCLGLKIYRKSSLMTVITQVIHNKYIKRKRTASIKKVKREKTPPKIVCANSKSKLLYSYLKT